MRRRADTGRPALGLQGYQLERQLQAVLGEPDFTRSRRIARYADGRVLLGYASRHNENQPRKWRTALRLRGRRRL